MYRLLLVVSLSLAVAASALAGEDHERVRQLMEEGRILPLEQILDQARSRHAGQLLEAELERDDKRYVYEIEIVDREGVVWDLEFDAATGKLIEEKRDD